MGPQTSGPWCSAPPGNTADQWSSDWELHEVKVLKMLFKIHRIT